MAKVTKKKNPHQRVSNQFSKAQKAHQTRKIVAKRADAFIEMYCTEPYKGKTGFGPVVSKSISKSKQGASHAWGLIKNSSHRYNK